MHTTMSGRHKAGQVIAHIIMILIAIYTLFPIVFLIFNSFKSNNEIIDSPVALPKEWTIILRSIARSGTTAPSP